MAAAPPPAVAVMDAPVPAVVVPAEPVVMAVVDAVPAVIGAAEVVEAESKVEGDRRPDIHWRTVGMRSGTVGGGRRTVDCATAQRSRQQQRKYQAFRGALCQDLHDRTESNTLTV